MIVRSLDLWQQALLGALAWAVLSFVVGYACHRLPRRALARDRFVLRLSRRERDTRFYERRAHIRAWKDRLPEAGGFFAGGVSKRALGTRSPEVLERFVAETRRAEIVHSLLLMCWPLFLVWCEPLMAVAMAVYSVVANVPCLVIQRYNRVRLLRVLKRL